MPICLRYYANEQDAVDSLNQAFVKIIQGLKKRNKSAPFDYWIRRIQNNTIIDIHRANKKYYSLHELKSELHENHAASLKDINYDNLDIDSEKILKLIQSLPEPGRTIFNLVALEGYSHKEVSEMLQVSIANSKYYLHKMRNYLKANLSELHAVVSRKQNSLKES
jgi:RNA polymerase sigma-70 factor (ECF subfamily)